MRNRSVIEVMVLTFTFVVCFMICGLGIMVAWIEISHPEVDTDRIVATLMSLISGILGALLGLLAGKAQTTDLHRRSDDTTNGFH